MAPTELSVAVCLFQQVGPTDFQSPLEIFGFITKQWVDRGVIPATVSHTFKPTFFGVTLDPIEPMSGPKLFVDRTYGSLKEEEQFDILLVPGGYGSSRKYAPQEAIEFLKKQAAGAKYILSICTGAEILAAADLLNGKRATTLKSGFLRTVEEFKDKNIEWVRKARWVVDGKVWTSSGMSAGGDLAYAFIKQLVGFEIAEIVRGTVEISIHEQDEDEFAAFHGLV